MSDENENNKRSTGETARRIWLAGIGAYGRAFTETREAVKDLTGEASEVFDDLVQKGQMFEAVIGMKSKEAMSKAGVKDIKMPDVGDFKLDSRIKKMRERLKSSVGFDEAPDAVSDDRLDAIEAKLDSVIALLKAQQAQKTPARKMATQRTKPAAKKSPAKKPATKKTAAKKS